MARTAKANVDYAKILRLDREIWQHENEIASETGKHMNWCKSMRKEISDKIDQISEAGGDRAAYRLNLKILKREKQIEKLRADAEADTLESANELKKNLAEFAKLPLGAAAVQHAKEREEAASREAPPPAKRGRGRPRKEQPAAAAPPTDMSSAAKREALELNPETGAPFKQLDDDGVVDLRSRRQRERETAREESGDESDRSPAA